MPHSKSSKPAKATLTQSGKIPDLKLGSNLVPHSTDPMGNLEISVRAAVAFMQLCFNELSKRLEADYRDNGYVAAGLQTIFWNVSKKLKEDYYALVDEQKTAVSFAPANSTGRKGGAR